MKKRMLINVADEEESRVAIVEDGTLEEFTIETASKEQIKGNIYNGVIVKVEPSLQAAFVDYGGNRHGFLPIGEIHARWFNDDGKSAEDRERRPRIQDVLQRNQRVVVQVVKEELGTKGASLSTYVSLPGRYLVLMPESETSGGISRKIEDEEERRKLKEIVTQLEPPPNMGIIVRTAGLNRNKAELQRDMAYLQRLWASIEDKSQQSPATALIYREQDLVIRSIRDYFTPDIQEVLVDDREVYYRARDFFQAVMPRYHGRVKLYREKKPLFAKYQLEEQLETVYSHKVHLKQGGSIVIDQTEALVAIDVNSGRATREKSIEETAFKTNTEAAQEVARQLRLRDLGGLIVIDFIDMRNAKHNQEIEKTLRQAVKRDKARTQVGRISPVRAAGTVAPAAQTHHPRGQLPELPALRGQRIDPLGGGVRAVGSAPDSRRGRQGHAGHRQRPTADGRGVLPAEPEAQGNRPTGRGIQPDPQPGRQPACTAERAHHGIRQAPGTRTRGRGCGD